MTPATRRNGENTGTVQHDPMKDQLMKIDNGTLSNNY
jgi:hypothetical protein